MTQPTNEQALKFFSAADVLLGPIPEIPPVAGKIITEGSLTLLAGEAGSGKTYATLSLGVCVAAGIDWIGIPTRQGTVLYIDEESGNTRLRHRVREVVNGYGLKAEQVEGFKLVTGEAFNLRDKEGIGRFERYIEGIRPILVIIDALADVISGADENSVKDVHPPLAELRRIAETYQTAIIVIHHTNRSGSYRGSSTLKSDVDNLIIIESGAKGVNFHSEKMRDIEPVKFSAITRFGEGTFYMEKSAEKQMGKGSPTQAKIVQAFRENGRLTRKQVHTITGIPLETIRKLVPKLEEAGTLIRVDGGKSGTEGEYELSN